MSRRWVISIFVTFALALGVLGGTVLAQDSGNGGTGGTTASSGGSLLERVAGKLGVTEDALRTAFDEAKSELWDERLEARIDELVASGRITEAEGQQLLEWYRSRPAILKGSGGFRFGSRHGDHGFGRGFHSFGFFGPRADADAPAAGGTGA